MTNLLSTGTSGLLAFQRALATTSHNIANVETEGYSRQRVELEARPPTRTGSENIGKGVDALAAERIADRFAIARVLDASSAHRQQEVHHELASQLDGLLASDSLSITPSLNAFFDAVQDANADPSSEASRQVLLSNTEQLATRFRSLHAEMESTRNETNGRIGDTVAEINEIATAIADLNKRIVTGGGTDGTNPPNDLLDQRDKLLTELADQVDIKTLGQEDGAVNVVIGNGLSLVASGQARQLRTAPDPTATDRVMVEIGKDGDWRAAGSQVTGGNLGGLLEFEGDTLLPALNELGRVALVVSEEMNLQHAKGVDLDGAFGKALFSTRPPAAEASSSNTGSGGLEVSIADATALQASDYTVKFDGTDYIVTRESDGETTTTSLPQTIDGLAIELTGTPAAGDEFGIAVTRRAAADFTSELRNARDLALASPLTTSSNVDNRSEASVTAATLTDADDPALYDPIDVVFTSESSFDLVNADTGAVVSAGQTYADGDVIALNGWEVVIDGEASAGDVHEIRRNADGYGSNVNGLALADMQTRSLIGGTSSINDGYATLVSQVGGETRTLRTRADALLSLQQDAVDRQQSISGVNLDEEAVNLARFEQAYQASAQIIKTADDLFQTILGVVAR